jgi:osomolarity two-component system response regulator SSK1
MINQAILSAWMKKHKIKFSVASNGQEAVEKWKGGGFHLILVRKERITSVSVIAHPMLFVDGHPTTRDERY